MSRTSTGTQVIHRICRFLYINDRNLNLIWKLTNTSCGSIRQGLLKCEPQWKKSEMWVLKKDLGRTRNANRKERDLTAEGYDILYLVSNLDGWRRISTLVNCMLWTMWLFETISLAFVLTFQLSCQCQVLSYNQTHWLEFHW